MTKKTKKPAFKPAFVADFTWCETAEDAYEELLTAKYEAKVPLTNYEIGKFCEYKIVQALDQFVDDLFGGHNAVVIDDGEAKACDAFKVTVKQPWYKRLWNWITRKK